MSLTALVTNQTPIAITNQPTNVTVTEGSSAQFAVGVSGGYPFYQWFKNGSPVSGANGATYSMASAQEADAGSYSVAVSNLVSSVTSSNATLTIMSVGPPQFTSITVAAGVATVQWSSHPGRTYRVQRTTDLVSWTNLGSDIAAAASTTSTIDAVEGDQQRFYRVLLVD
jgi:hypothetical protein